MFTVLLFAAAVALSRSTVTSPQCRSVGLGLLGVWAGSGLVLSARAVRVFRGASA